MHLIANACHEFHLTFLHNSWSRKSAKYVFQLAVSDVSFKSVCRDNTLCTGRVSTPETKVNIIKTVLT
jgi:hypothetical protein